MKPRQLTWKWLPLGFFALVLIAVAALPHAVGSSSHVRDQVIGALSAWSGGQVKLIGPLRIHYFPEVSLKGGLDLRKADRLPLVESIASNDVKIALDLPSLLIGRVRVNTLRLGSPVITLKPSIENADSADRAALIGNLLAEVPVSVVRIRNGTIKLPGAGAETIREISARIDANGGTLSGSGSAKVRNEPVRFALDTGAIRNTQNGPAAPIRFSFASAPLKAKINGYAAFTSGLALAGDMQADAPDLRRFLGWAGVPVPAGDNLKQFSAAGTMHWARGSLTFDNGSYTLDGNSADGVLAVTTGARPRIEGTLAFEQLALDPYLDGAKQASAAAQKLDWPLLRTLDADLRISANAISANGLDLGHSAFTITAKQGALESELGELELCGGSASGLLGLDVKDQSAKMTLTANLTRVALASCLQAFASQFAITGNANLKADLTSEGVSLGELADRLNGNFQVEAVAGSLPVDLPNLLANGAHLRTEGWSRNVSTPFETLDGDCRLAAGHIWCQSFNMKTARGLVSGSGDIDIERGTLDWTLSLAGGPVSMPVANGDTEPAFSLRGALAQPTIRRNDRAALGEGALPAVDNPVSAR